MGAGDPDYSPHTAAGASAPWLLRDGPVEPDKSQEARSKKASFRFNVRHSPESQTPLRFFMSTKSQTELMNVL